MAAAAGARFRIGAADRERQGLLTLLDQNGADLLNGELPSRFARLPVLNRRRQPSGWRRLVRLKEKGDYCKFWKRSPVIPR